MSPKPQPSEADAETSEAKRQTFRLLIEEGIHSPKVEAAEAFARLRKFADNLAR